MQTSKHLRHYVMLFLCESAYPLQYKNSVSQQTARIMVQVLRIQWMWVVGMRGCYVQCGRLGKCKFGMSELVFVELLPFFRISTC